MKLGDIIGQGRTADIHLWDHEKVVKLFKKDTSRSSIEWEFDISSKIYKGTKGNNLTIPRPFKIIKIEDRTGIIFEQIRGRTMLDEISNKPWKIKGLSRQLAKLHIDLHKCINSTLLSYRLDLQFQINKAPFLSKDTKKKLLEVVAQLDDSNEICHGDFHPDNIMLSPKGPVIIDWLNARRGNKLLDVARTSIMIKYGHIPSQKPFIMRTILKHIRNILYREYIKTFLKTSGITIDKIQKWEAPIAAARLNEGIPIEEKEALVEMINSRIGQLKISY